MKILNRIIALVMIIYEGVQSLSLYVGNNIINILEDFDIPVIEKLNQYSELPMSYSVKAIGFMGLILSLLIIRNIRYRLRKARAIARRLKNTNYGGYSDRSTLSKYGDNYNGNFHSSVNNRENKEQFLFEQNIREHMGFHEEMVANHFDRVDNDNNEIIIQESISHCMDDAHNAATPSDFGGHASSIFDDYSWGFDDCSNDFDNHSHDFDNMGGGFDNF